jgi:hypothetical protein
MTKSELKIMIRKILKEELSKRHLKEAITDPNIDEKAVDACLARINANSGARHRDWATVKLSKEDLKKALKIGTNLSHGSIHGMTIPAQIVDSADLVFLYSDFENTAIISLELHGDTRSETGLDVNGYLNDCLPIIGDLELNFASEDEALEYFKKEILVKADEVAHNIIQNAWLESGFKDYSGITNYNV